VLLNVGFTANNLMVNDRECGRMGLRSQTKQTHAGDPRQFNFGGIELLPTIKPGLWHRNGQLRRH